MSGSEQALFVGGVWDGQRRSIPTGFPQYRVVAHTACSWGSPLDPQPATYEQSTYLRMAGGTLGRAFFLIEDRNSRLHPMERLLCLLAEGYRNFERQTG